MTITANDEPTEIEADVDKRFSSIVVNLPVRQTGTGTPSPSNPRPFTMWTDVSLYVSDTEEADEPTLAIELPTPMYGGKVDMVRGEIATTYNSKESGTGWEMTEEGQFRCQVSAYNNGDETSTDVADLYAVHYEAVSNKDAYDATDDLTCGLATIAGTTYLYVNDAQYTTLESFATHIADEVFVFRAHIPMSDVTEPHIVYLPAGTSYVWADAGFVDLTVSGTPPLSLPNSLGKPLKAWSVDVLPYQEGSGNPSPDNVRSIHGTNQISFVTSGKNLLDFTVMSQNGVVGTKLKGVAHIAGTATATSFPVNFVATEFPAGTYVWSISGLPQGTQCSYSKNGTWTGYVTQGGTVTLTERATIGGYISVSNGTTVDADIKIQLEFGSTATDFMPYVAPSQTVLTLPQTVYTGTIGSEGGESRSAEVDLGTLEWSPRTYGGNQFYTAFVSNMKAYGNYEVPNWYCEAYKPVSANNFIVAMNDGSISHGVTGFYIDYIIIRNSNYTTASELAESLQGVKLVYELATPVQFSITAPSIPTPTGSATTWATAEDGTVDSMEVTYVGKPT